MNEEKAISLRAESPGLPTQVPTAQEMMWHLVKSGITSENVTAMKELAALQRDFEKNEAEKKFNIAFVAMQREIPKVQATKQVMTKDGKTLKYMVAPFDEIMDQVGPILAKHGFSVSFSEGVAAQPGRIAKVCFLMHESGHSRQNSYSVRIGQGPPGASESQADGSAHSYAKRGALCDALNIQIGRADADASMEGGPVTKEQADELERRAKELNCDIPKFLEFAGARTFAEIPANNYDLCDEALTRKERQRR